MKIFISYRRAEDNKSYIVGLIYDKLAEVFRKDEIFRDTYDIVSGTEWRNTLKREINSCKVMLVIIGPEWASLANPNGEKRLFDPEDITRWEVETGLRRSREGSATVIPVLVTGAKIPNKVDLPESLHPLLEKNAVEIRNFPDLPRDMEKLIHDIEISQGFSPDDKPESEYEPEMVYIAKGLFLMGSLPGKVVPLYESPQVDVDLPGYRIGICPVTNSQYEEFIRKMKKSPPLSLGWGGQSVPDEIREYPVTGVTWFEAVEYCDWLTAEYGHKYSLPNEAQWEKACRGGANYLYPWGDEFDQQRSNHGRNGLASVRAYPPQNDFGLFDLVGNVRQWTRSLWGEKYSSPDLKFAYPWKDDRRNDLSMNSQIWRVVRGGSYLDKIDSLRSSARDRQLPGERGFPGKQYGFRVVRND